MISILFEVSPEHVIAPDPSINGKFLVHFHQAKRAGNHYDLRLGKDGALFSWATRKLPDLINGEVKRILLFRQPDHDPSWFDFEGEITDGYGAGSVSIWDKGKYKVIRWDKNIITVDFKGTKLIGTYTLLLYNKNQWLMFKSIK